MCFLYELMIYVYILIFFISMQKYEKSSWPLTIVTNNAIWVLDSFVLH